MGSLCSSCKETSERRDRKNQQSQEKNDQSNNNDNNKNPPPKNPNLNQNSNSNANNEVDNIFKDLGIDDNNNNDSEDIVKKRSLRISQILNVKTHTSDLPPDDMNIINKIISFTNPKDTTPTELSIPSEDFSVYLPKLYSQYMTAKDYFDENDLKEQQVDCIHKCKLINKARGKLEENKENEIDKENLPKPINNEYIFGYSNDERKDIFKKILIELTLKKNGISKKMNDYMDELKKLKKNQFAKMQTQAKQKLDKDKEEKQKVIEEINKIAKCFQDRWTPAPEFIRIDEEKDASVNIGGGNVFEEGKDEEKQTIKITKYYPSFYPKYLEKNISNN